jgi:hypothetical protein
MLRPPLYFAEYADLVADAPGWARRTWRPLNRTITLVCRLIGVGTFLLLPRLVEPAATLDIPGWKDRLRLQLFTRIEPYLIRRDQRFRDGSGSGCNHRDPQVPESKPPVSGGSDAISAPGRPDD